MNEWMNDETHRRRWIQRRQRSYLVGPDGGSKEFGKISNLPYKPQYKYFYILYPKSFSKKGRIFLSLWEI